MKKQPSNSYGLFKTFSLTFLSVCLLLTGCVTTGGRTSSSLQRTVKITAADSAFALNAKQTLEELGNVTVVSEDDYSELTLILDGRSGVASAQVLSKPKIVGILRKENKPGTYQISYTLVDSTGTPIAKGEVYGVGHEQEGFYPALSSENTAAQQAAQADALKQLNGQISKDLGLNGFRSVISSQLLATNQVAAPVADVVALKPGQSFYVKDMPQTKLKFVGFTQGANGQKQALLEVAEGETPALGTVIYLMGSQS